MSKTYLQVQIGEESIGLKYNMGAGDILSDKEVLDNLSRDNTTKNMTLIIYAGMMGNCYAKKKEPDFTLDDVRNMIKALDKVELMALDKILGPVLTAAYPNENEVSVSGEGNTDTQPQKVLNVA